MLTEEQVREYVLCDGTRCPYCGSDELVVGEQGADDGILLELVGCDGCEESWYDVYRLTGVSTEDSQGEAVCIEPDLDDEDPES